ncbi:MAG: right-handed parallel beta-helix repeat-containing protein, partial [Planctomycetota bacterium]
MLNRTKKERRNSQPAQKHFAPSFKRRLRLESLEDRRMLATFVVNEVDGRTDPDLTDGSADVDLETPGEQITLQSALQNASLSDVSNTIRFDLDAADDPDGDGIAEVDLTNQVASQFDFLTISGRNLADDSVGIEIRGGLAVRGEFNLVEDLVFPDGGVFLSGELNVFRFNDVGYSADGVPQSVTSSVVLHESRDSAVSSNRFGEIQGPAITVSGGNANSVEDNTIGLDIGLNDFGDVVSVGPGILLENNADSVNIEANVIANVEGHGIEVRLGRNFEIIENEIGVDALFNIVAPNTGNGIHIRQGSGRITNNIIAHNGGDGIHVIPDSGFVANVEIGGNDIESNQGDGIDLA